MVSHEEWHKEYFCRVVTLRDGLISGMEECRRRTRPAAAPDVGPK